MFDHLLHLEIVTPGKIDYSGDVQNFTAPGAEGSFQILPNHAPFITNLQVGKVKFITKDGDEKVYATSGGVVEIHENRISMLAETIEAKEKIDVGRALEARNRAEEKIKTEHGTELEAARSALLRAMNRLRVAGHVEV
jgi:F-type H+-transporting ATPase subunit epsilon